MEARQLIFRVHAIQRIFQHGVTHEDVRHTLATGEAIEGYLDDTPYPSRLVLGWCGARRIHIVIADNMETR